MDCGLLRVTLCSLIDTYRRCGGTSPVFDPETVRIRSFETTKGRNNSENPIKTLTHIRIVYEGVGRFQGIQDRIQWRSLANVVSSLRVPYKSGNFLTSRTTISFSVTTALRVVTRSIKETPELWTGPPVIFR